MSNEDTSRITADLVLKLFDTLKDSNSHLKHSVEKQTDAIIHLTGLLKEGVKPSDLKKIIDEYNMHSSSHLDNIDTCTGTIKSKSDVILSLLKVLSKKINTMILVVSISAGLMTMAYFFVSNSVNNIVDKKIEYKIQKTEPNLTEKAILKQIEEIKKQIGTYHENQYYREDR